MKYCEHVTRHNSLENDVMIGPMPGLKRQGGQHFHYAFPVNFYTQRVSCVQIIVRSAGAIQHNPTTEGDPS